jgi:hypothetical protein
MLQVDASSSRGGYRTLSTGIGRAREAVRCFGAIRYASGKAQRGPQDRKDAVQDKGSFTRGTLRGLFVSIGLMAVHSSSVS